MIWRRHYFFSYVCSTYINKIKIKARCIKNCSIFHYRWCREELKSIVSERQMFVTLLCVAYTKGLCCAKKYIKMPLMKIFKKKILDRGWKTRQVSHMPRSFASMFWVALGSSKFREIFSCLRSKDNAWFWLAAATGWEKIHYFCSGLIVIYWCGFYLYMYRGSNLCRWKIRTAFV